MKNTEINNSYNRVWIQRRIWESKILSATEKLFMIEITNLDYLYDKCIPSNAHFSKLFNLSINRCSQIISSLKKKSEISTRFVYEGKNRVKYRIITLLNFDNSQINHTEKNNQSYTGLWIERWIWESYLLSSIEKLFLTEISILEKYYNICNPSNKHFSQVFNLTSSRCSQIIASLVRKKIITAIFTYGNGDKNNIHERKIFFQNKNILTQKVEIQPKNTELEVATFFYNKLLINYPTLKKPDIDIWAEEFSMIHDISNLTYKEIKDLILFINENSYWQPIITDPFLLSRYLNNISSQFINQNRKTHNEKINNANRSNSIWNQYAIQSTDAIN